MSRISDRITTLPPEKLALLEKLLNDDRGARMEAIKPRGTANPCAVSFAQERLWLLDQLRPGTPAYNIPVFVPLSSYINPAPALEWSINEIVRRHESLRTTFRIQDKELVQVVHPSVFIPLNQIELTEPLREERYAKAGELANLEAHGSFDLSKGPLLRGVLIKLSDVEYWLLITMHHIVSDAWSTAIFFRELTVLYEAFFKGQQSPLPPLPVQYADFAIWQREWLAGARIDEHLSYWRRKLSGAPPLLTLSDKPRPRIESYRGTARTFNISPRLTSSLRVLSHDHETTLFMTLLSAFCVLLRGYTGQSDIVVGSPIANRTRAEIEGLIGFFVNVLVLRTDLSGNPSFLEILKRVKMVTMEAYAHQDLPFEKLVEELQPERNLSHNSLFQIAIALQNTSRPVSSTTAAASSSASASSSSASESLPTIAGTSKFDLTLAMMEGESEIYCSFEYNTDLLAAGTINRLAENFLTVLQSVTSDPNQKLSDINLINAAERRQLMQEWNATDMPYKRDACIHDLFEEQAVRTPEAIAVSGGVNLTYRELNTTANQLAHYLRKKGVSTENLVGVLMGRSEQVVVSFLGILKAGGCYVPLDPDYPVSRLNHMLADSDARLLITLKEFKGHLEKIEATKRAGFQVVVLDEEWSEIATEPEEPPVVSVGPGNLAYMIYTSGSMGVPKGTMNVHRSVINLLHWTQKMYGLTSSDRFIQKTPFSFDPSIWEIFWPLLNGATLVMAAPETERNPLALARFIIEKQITGALFVSSAMQVFLEEPESAECRTLKNVFVGGEAVPASLESLLKTKLDAALHNIYGPTETCIITIVGESDASHEGPTMPIGRPVANTSVYLLDDYMKPVPIGVAGQIYIAGDCLGRGYYHDPALTAEKFVPNPFSSQPGMRLYKTGDLARYLADGQIEFLRRLDHQVKVRGFRIEVAEAEAVLMTHPAVRQAVVSAAEIAPGDVRLIGYVACKPEAEVPAKDLREYTAERLPHFMVPTKFIILETLPVTPNDKIDRAALPDPRLSFTDSEETYVAPRTPVEAELARIWCEVLGCERVGVHDNFFDLGGHSLTAVQVVTRVRLAFNLELPLHSVFEMPTIEAIALTIVRTRITQQSTNQTYELLKLIENLSEEQARDLLSNQANSSSR